MAVDLPSPCPPSRIITESALQPGRITRATAEIGQRLPTFAEYSLAWTPSTSVNQLSSLGTRSHSSFSRYSRTG
ncbi:hypothetical protein D3C86_2012570 [compost metagenome]